MVVIILVYFCDYDMWMMVFFFFKLFDEFVDFFSGFRIVGCFVVYVFNGMDLGSVMFEDFFYCVRYFIDRCICVVSVNV